MSEFKVGDTVWFLVLNFYEMDVKIYGDYEAFNPSRVHVKTAIIKEIHEEDKVYFLEGSPGIYFNETYKSKQDCIDAFKERLDEL